MRRENCGKPAPGGDVLWKRSGRSEDRARTHVRDNQLETKDFVDRSGPDRVESTDVNPG